MRLHRVRLKNYRGVADCTVDFAGDSVTIVEGDNEVGKSCIPESLDLILSKPDSSQAREALDVRPVHRDAGPEVEVEISAGQYRFIYSKRWHRQPQTRLEILKPNREQVSGRAAHERVREILDETVDKALWEALCIEQGTKVALPMFDVRSLGQALDAAAGGDSTGGRGDDLWERICSERARYWTSTGQPRIERKTSERNLQEAREAVSAIEDRILGIEADAEEIARRRGQRERLTGARESATREEQELGERWAQLERLRADVERLEADCRAAVAQRDQIDGDLQRRVDLAQNLENRNEELATLEAAAERAAPVLSAVAARTTVAEQALDAAAEALSEARAAQRMANDDRDHHRRRIEVAQLDERRERVSAAQVALSAAEADLESARVDDDLVERIEKAHLAVVRAEAAASGAATSLDVTALSDVTVLIAGEEVALAAGTTSEVPVVDETQLVVPGVVEVGVRAGVGSRDSARKLREASTALLRLCESGDVSGLDEARRAAEQRKQAGRQRAEAIATIERDLRDLTLDVMVQKIEGLSKRVAAYSAGRSADPPLPADFEESKLLASRADRIAAEREADHDRCRDAAEEARDQLHQAELDDAVEAEKLGNARRARKHAVAVLAAAREERSDADLRASLVAAQHTVDSAAEALEQARTAVTEADPDSLGLLLENARAAAERAEKEFRANEEQLTKLRGRLELQGEEGLHGELGEAQNRCQHLERTHEHTEARAHASQLLYETFDARRAESRRRYLQPFRDRIEQFGRIVFGPTFEVELDDDLRPARRTLDGVTLDLEQLSVGAREQLGVLSRLACAAIVSPDGGGAPVVIDDALGWSDPSRLVRMGAAIAAAGRECQIIVLTCTPGRYSHVGNAKVVTLPA